MFKHIKLVMVALFLLALPIQGQTADLLRERINEYGFIDWLSYTVYAKGVGIAPADKKNTTQAKPLAYRAAVVVAQRNLLEVIKGVHIDSNTILEKRIIVNDKIVSKIEGIVKYCQEAPLSFSGGVWLPVASEKEGMANWMGMLADLTMIGAFRPNTLTLDLAANYRSSGEKRW